MINQPTGGHPFPVAGLQAYTSEFPPLPSNCSNATKLLNPSLPKEISFAESLKQLAQQSHDSPRRDITMVEGIPQIKWTEEEATINKSRPSCARIEYQRRTLQMSRADTTSSKARRPLEDTQDYSMS
ncbi:hypothetical protein KY289_008589 [Solanum tuberosum]|nr:hypothetical protein KY289_008589 [Solanum tuberosum]